MRQPITCIHTHLWCKNCDPFVWVRRGDKGQFYTLTRSSDARLWYVLLGRGGRTQVSLGGWMWWR